MIKKFLPIIFVVLVSIFICRDLIFGPTLIFGDNPLQVPGSSASDIFNSWSPTNFGTTIRQGLFSFRDSIFLLLSPNSHIYYILSFILPLFFIPINYYFILRKIGLKNKLILILSSLVGLLNPIVIGDFSKAQTFWIYLTIPWVIYFIIKIFYLEDLKVKNFVLLAIFSFLTFGFLPPIVLPLAIISVQLALLSILFRTRTNPAIQYIKRLALGIAIFIPLFIFLSLPYLLVVSSGQAAYVPTSSVGDYYNNYVSTTFSNLFRLSGNNGNGLTLLGYNTFSFTNIFGLIIISVTILYLCMKHKYKIRYFLICFIPYLTSIFILNLLATDINLGSKLFSSQFIVTTIRDPAKVFEIILPLVIFSFAISLEALIKHISIGSRVKPYMAIGLTAACIAAYAWPAYSGNLGIYINRNNTSNYQPDADVAAIVNDSKNEPLRSIIIPSDHRDELNYQNVSSSLSDGLRLGGSLPYTNNLTQEIQNSVNSDGYLAQVLSLASIKNVYINERNINSNYLFGLLTLNIPYHDFKQNLDETLNFEGNVNPNVLKYTSNNVMPIISSPTNIAVVNNSSELHTLLPLYNQANVLTGVNSKYNQYNTYIQTSDPTNIKMGSFGQLYNPNLLSIKYKKISSTDDNQLFELTTLNPATNKYESPQLITLPINSRYIFINNNPIEISDTDIFAVRSGNTVLTPATNEDIYAAKDDSSIENLVAKDASNSRPGIPKISSSISYDHTEGKESLKIESSSHLAYVSKRIYLPDSSSTYKISFDYKYIQGIKPSYGVYQGDKLISSSQNILQSASSWTTNNVYVNPDGNKYFDINFYVDSTGQTSSSLFDNLRVAKITKSASQVVQFQPNKPDFQIQKDYVPQNVNTKNLIENGSFEDKNLWGTVGDASNTAPGLPKFEVKQSTTSIDGKYSLSLSSNNHTAFVSRKMSTFNANSVYKLSFWYKNTSGDRPSFTLWEDGINKSIVHASLDLDNSWKQYTYSFIPDQNATSIELYLYSSSKNSLTTNLFDKVEIIEQPLVSSYLNQITNTDIKQSNLLIKSNRESTSKLDLKLRDGNGVIAFNESYHDGWRAYYLSNDNKLVPLPAASHAIFNGFANAWIIRSADIPKGIIKNNQYNVVLKYEPNQKYVTSLIVSAILFSLIIITLLAIRLKSKSK